MSTPLGTPYRRGGSSMLLAAPRILANGLGRACSRQRSSYGAVRMIVILSFLIWSVFVVRRYLEDRDFETTRNFCDDKQAALQTFENYVSEGYFASLQKDTISFINERKEDKKYFNPEGFGKHLAFAYKFNDEGLLSIRERADIKFLYPLLSMMRLPKANGFTVRILAGLPGNGTESVARPHSDAGNYRTDDGREYSVVPYTTSVFYITVPEDIKGGQIELRDENPHRGQHKQRWSLEPKENMLVIFRGDIPHTVHGYTTKTEKIRVSIVFQQFTLPPRVYKWAEFMDDH